MPMKLELSEGPYKQATRSPIDHRAWSTKDDKSMIAIEN